MEFWLPLIFEPDVLQYVEVARAAERIGFTGIALPDHVAIPSEFVPAHPGEGDPFTASVDHPDPFTTITAMAAGTTTLRFMTYVYVLTMRDPFTVAKQAAFGLDADRRPLRVRMRGGLVGGGDRAHGAGSAAPRRADGRDARRDPRALGSRHLRVPRSPL